MTRQTSDLSHSRLANDSAEILVSVVMPCLNEARTLAECVEQAHAGCKAAVASHRSGVEFSDELGYEIIIADVSVLSAQPGDLGGGRSACIPAGAGGERATSRYPGRRRRFVGRIPDGRTSQRPPQRLCPLCL